MKAKIAGFILLLGLSAAAQAHPGHHHPNTFEQPPASDNNSGGGKNLPEKPHGGMHHGGGTGGVTSPVPEPETYAMLMAGLGLVGALARRSKRKQLSQ